MKKNILLTAAITFLACVGSLSALTCPENNQPVPFVRLTPQEVSFYRNTCHYVVDFDTGNLVHSSQYRVQAIS